jgi:hypothetical protein
MKIENNIKIIKNPLKLSHRAVIHMYDLYLYVTVGPKC